MSKRVKVRKLTKKQQEQERIKYIERNTRLKGYWGDRVVSEKHDSMFQTMCGEMDHGCLWIRVGMVFRGNKVSKVPGIWIDFQKKAWGSDLEHVMLMSPEVWAEMKREIERSLRRWKRRPPKCPTVSKRAHASSRKNVKILKKKLQSGR